MNIPYGISNYAQLREGGYVYVDKTPFIPRLEDKTRGLAYLVFLRPRRFGKSTLLSLGRHRHRRHPPHLHHRRLARHHGRPV